MKLDDAPAPPPPPIGVSGDTGMAPPGHAVPSPPPAAAPPSAQVMRGSQPMQAPPAQPYPGVAATGVPVMQTTAPPAVVMTHAPQPQRGPERNMVPWLLMLGTVLICWPCCPCAMVWVIIEELEYKDKREAWEKKMEAERQHDRAFAMQAAHAAGMVGAQQVSVPMAPYNQPAYNQPAGYPQPPPQGQQPAPKPM